MCIWHVRLTRIPWEHCHRLWPTCCFLFLQLPWQNWRYAPHLPWITTAQPQHVAMRHGPAQNVAGLWWCAGGARMLMWEAWFVTGWFAKPLKLMMLDFGDDAVRVLQGLVGPHLRLSIALWDGTTTPPVWVGFHESWASLRIHVHRITPCSDFPNAALVRIHSLQISQSLPISAGCMCEGLSSPSHLSSHLQDSFKHKRDPTSHWAGLWKASWRRWWLRWL